MHHLIFEGAELAGKSWLMSQIYNHLEPRYNKSGFVLDGCHWFNTDVGIFGTENGKSIINNFVHIFEDLKDSNILVEKFYLSDQIYSKLHRNALVTYPKVEEKLLKLNFKIVLVTFPEDPELLRGRIVDRLNIYPHYKNILNSEEWYIRQQQEYIEAVKNSKLPYIIIKTDQLPDNNLVKEILDWIGEN
ncbi:hypothetical protein ISS03_05680 [Patescibacteria group bacterium]|nr:hypothetical protein [Patescibacteria group bacterium]